MCDGGRACRLCANAFDAKYTQSLGVEMSVLNVGTPGGYGMRYKLVLKWRSRSHRRASILPVSAGHSGDIPPDVCAQHVGVL